MKWWIIKVCLILWQPCEQTLVWTDGRQQRWEVQVFVLNRIADSQTVNWTDLLFESFRSFTGAALQRPLVAEVNVTNEQTTDPYERTAVSTDRVKLTRGRTAESWTNPFCFTSLSYNLDHQRHKGSPCTFVFHDTQTSSWQSYFKFYHWTLNQLCGKRRRAAQPGYLRKNEICVWVKTCRADKVNIFTLDHTQPHICCPPLVKTQNQSDLIRLTSWWTLRAAGSDCMRD